MRDGIYRSAVGNREINQAHVGASVARETAKRSFIVEVIIQSQRARQVVAVVVDALKSLGRKIRERSRVAQFSVRAIECEDLALARAIAALRKDAGFRRARALARDQIYHASNRLRPV